MPIIESDGHALRAFCVIDTAPREWSERELATIGTLAACAAAGIARTESAATAREARERAEEDKLAALARLCSTMAHNLDNVLAGVAGYADLLQGNPSLGAAARADVEEIVSAIERGRARSGAVASVASVGRTAAPVRALTDVNDVVAGILATDGAEGVKLVLASGIP